MIRRAVPVFVVALAALVAPFATTPPTATAAILPCSGRPSRDLNGDTFKDAVVGDPYAMVEGQVEAGTVTVLFGDATGRFGEGGARGSSPSATSTRHRRPATTSGGPSVSSSPNGAVATRS